MSKKKLKRPFATYYYGAAPDAFGDHVSQGAAASEEGAIRASIVRVFVGQYAKAIVYDRQTGVAVYHLVPEKGGFKLRFGSGVHYKEWK